MFFWTGIVIALVAATVLFANNGRNILALARMLHVNLEIIDLTFGGRRKPPVEPQAKPVIRPVSWPWLPPRASEWGQFEFAAPAEDTCDSIATGSTEAPTLVKQSDGGWECASFRQDGEASLFVQLRTSKGRTFSGFRIKFNLDAQGMTDTINDETIRLMKIGVRPLDLTDDMLAALKEKLTSRSDFYFLLGYYPVSFKREFGDAARYNLILLNRQATLVQLPRMVAMEKPAEATTFIDSPLADAVPLVAEKPDNKPADPVSGRAAKGSRLSTPSSASPH